MHELAAQIRQAVDVIRNRWAGQPRVGIILGTGLGGLAQQIRTEATLAYQSIPHFPRSTAVGHAGQLVCGQLQGVAVVAMEGRFHSYEGYSLRQITFPVRVMKALGAEILDRLQRLRRHESPICGRRHHGHRGPPQPDERESVGRRKTMTRWGRVFPTCRPPTTAADRPGLGDCPAGEFRRPQGRVCGRDWSEPGNPPNIASSARSAPTWWGCRPCPR